MIKKVLQIGTLALTLAWAASVAQAQESEIVASLDRLEGRVDVIQAETGRTIQGRNGLLLRTGDTVVTLKKARATLKFRDGSEVRLFPASRFVIQGVRESRTRQRAFTFRLFMKVGSFWGNFVRQRQVAQIAMPTATIGIKGTTLRAVERNNKARVALTEGLIEVRNERGAIDLTPGQRLTDFTRTDDLATKLEDIPLKIDLKSQKRELTFPRGQAEEVFVSLQLVDIKTGREINRPGKIYFRSNYDRITYPPVAELNQRGAARLPLLFAPPEISDDKLEGNIFVWALIDEEFGDDTAEGRILFTFPVRGGKERIRVEAETGDGKRVN